ncbi:hypothetical protein E2562_001870 [Oryza meyeriana var. granulata]|uniref:Uncharacterized protein n=1 Tax=Oryza meyeriana var. granulata TaxID=110450 RepID=A0A6G1C2W3_9ORYZ|nr:hypothetical protein E2562_001870 [Oryza meyeriana var. granulata]
MTSLQLDYAASRSSSRRSSTRGVCFRADTAVLVSYRGIELDDRSHPALRWAAEDDSVVACGGQEAGCLEREDGVEGKGANNLIYIRRYGSKRWIVINNKRIVKEGAGSKTRVLDGKTSARREGAQLSSSSIKLVFAKSELVKRSQKAIVK